MSLLYPQAYPETLGGDDVLDLDTNSMCLTSADPYFQLLPLSGSILLLALNISRMYHLLTIEPIQSTE